MEFPGGDDILFIADQSWKSINSFQKAFLLHFLFLADDMIFIEGQQLNKLK